jgi:hypothetical protein
LGGGQRAENWIEVLGLPPPHLDDGDVVWSVPDGDISRCFRQMSLRVHPDKNCSPQAGVAFRGKEAPEQAPGSLWARICPAWVDGSAAWFVLCWRLCGSLTVWSPWASRVGSAGGRAGGAAGRDPARQVPAKGALSAALLSAMRRAQLFWFLGPGFRGGPDV